MHTKYDLLPEGDDKIVYVREVAMDDLPQDVREKLGDLDHIYAVCSTAGTQLALVADRTTAFALARHNDLAPVNVH